MNILQSQSLWRQKGTSVEAAGWTETELLARCQERSAKLALTGRLRRETTLTMGWIAKGLQMGTRQSAAMKLHRWGKEKGDTNLRQTKAMVC